jgi:serine/threonine protein kinase
MAQQKAVEKPVEDADDLVDELAPGTKLLKGQYTITRYLNSGGFGITYLAKDSLDRDVVIKECFPSAFSRRSKTMVAARSRAHTAELRSVVQLFVKEARNLSKIVHPNIVAVHQVFEDNGTAYMALDFVDGLDLQQIIDGQGKMPTTPEIVILVEKLLHAIGFIHANDMLHRDISPDNVLISNSGEPVLIDFGAAREQASKSNRAMSALRVVKDGYSPQEFYIAGSEQGPWSDLYALGATFFHLIAGEAPVNGQARLAALAEDRPDPYTKLEGRFEGYPPGFLAAIDKALSTMPKQRVQSAGEWLAMFSNNSTVSAVTGRVVKTKEPLDDVVNDLVRAERTASSAAGGNSDAVSFGAPPQFARSKAQVSGSVAGDVGTDASAKSGVGTVQVVAGIAATLAVIGAGILMMGGNDAPPAVDPQPTAEVSAPSAASPETSGQSTTATAPAEPAQAPADVTPPEPATPEAAPAQAVAEAAPATQAVASPEAPAPSEPATAAETGAATVTSAAPEAVTETSPAPAQDAAADNTVATAEVADPEPAPQAVAMPEPTDTEAPEVVAEPAADADQTGVAAEATAADTPALAAPEGTLRANQVNFAAWDIELPFVEDNRIIAGERTAIIRGMLPGVDVATAGTWLAPGLLIYKVNGNDVQQSGSIATAILNTMNVDPDGNARVVVEFAGSSLERESGLLTMPVNRLISLGNGVNFEVRTLDGEWRTIVTGVTVPSATTLRQGDILYRDKTTGTPLDQADSLETIVAQLVEQKVGVTEFSVLRDNRISDAAMQLATD